MDISFRNDYAFTFTPDAKKARRKERKEGKKAKRYHRFKTYARKRLIKRYGSVCLLCGKDLARSELTLDHIIPLSLGGTDSLSNLQPACQACNEAKGNVYPH